MVTILRRIGKNCTLSSFHSQPQSLQKEIWRSTTVKKNRLKNFHVSFSPKLAYCYGNCFSFARSFEGLSKSRFATYSHIIIGHWVDRRRSVRLTAASASSGRRPGSDRISVAVHRYLREFRTATVEDKEWLIIKND